MGRFILCCGHGKKQELCKICRYGPIKHKAADTNIKWTVYNDYTLRSKYYLLRFKPYN